LLSALLDPYNGPVLVISSTVEIEASRTEFIGILEAHLKDRGFCSDPESLLRNGIIYDPQAAGKYVIANLLSQLRE
jgi:hypothetical protein